MDIKNQTTKNDDHIFREQQLNAYVDAAQVRCTEKSAASDKLG